MPLTVARAQVSHFGMAIRAQTLHLPTMSDKHTPIESRNSYIVLIPTKNSESPSLDSFSKQKEDKSCERVISTWTLASLINMATEPGCEHN